MTSALDGRTHTVTTADLERGMVEGVGRYRAACGADVLAASLTARPGARCRGCAPIVAVDGRTERPDVPVGTTGGNATTISTLLAVVSGRIRRRRGASRSRGR